MLPHALLSKAKEKTNVAIQRRRALHAMAETGFDLPKTTEYIKKALQKEGLSPRTFGSCGVIADIPCSHADAKTVLLRADADALPIEEESGLPFAAENGNMHACGHDMHAAMLLSAVPLLLGYRSHLSCHVRLMFQSAEEILGGAYRMLAGGAADGISAAFALHVLPDSPFPTGEILLPPSGAAAPEAAFFRIDIQGKGGHGALPEDCVDALRVAALTVPVLLSRPFGPVALSLGNLQAGRAANVLPDSAFLSGTLRSMKEGALVSALNEMEKSARGVASAFDARATLSVTSRCPRLMIDGALRERGKDVFSALLGEDAVHPMTQVAGASEDFAFISEKCPSLTVALAAGRREDGYAFPLHHPRTVFDEGALPYGAALYAAFALGLAEQDL